VTLKDKNNERMQLLETFCTARLIAARLRANHLGELCRMHHDSRVMVTLGGLRCDDETRRFLDKPEFDISWKS
jgi:[ribosomal protein S5]-alanine N-acetyltransferase